MLNKIKLMLGINDNDIDDRLNLIVSNATSRVKMLLGGIEPPAELEYIIIDVAVARFNRIGSEGLTSHTVEGESLAFCEDDFATFDADIQAYLGKQESGTRGKLRFI